MTSTSAPAPPPHVAAPATRAALCEGGGAGAVGNAWAFALQRGAKPAELAAELQRRAALAPEGIRADFDRLVQAQLPLLALLAQAETENRLAGVATDPVFQRAVQALADPQVATATAAVNQWFAANCPNPG